MSSTLKIMLSVLFVAAVSTPAFGDFRDYNYKAWNQVGKQRMSQSSGEFRSSYRAPSTAIVRTESAPDRVAQAPAERRSYSYEPANQGTVQNNCVNNDSSQNSNATEPTKQARRSYSYEPSIADSSAPAMQHSNRTSRGELSIDVGRRAKGF